MRIAVEIKFLNSGFSGPQSLNTVLEAVCELSIGAMDKQLGSANTILAVFSDFSFFS